MEELTSLITTTSNAHETPVGDVLVFLAAGVLFAALFQRIRFGQVLGYLAAGALIGPFGLGMVADTEEASMLAEFGVVFLLFAIGLELSFERLIVMRKLVFGLGAAQVVLTGIVIALAALGVGLPPTEAFVVGGALALSSTAFVIQLLNERGEFATLHGRAAFSILLFQDLAVVPLLVILPLLGAGDAGSIMLAMAIAVAKAIAALVVIVLIGRLLLRPLYKVIAQTRAQELFTAVTLLIVLGIGWATQTVGLSMALGAFLAGLLVSESEYRHQVEADIGPFRGILIGLFFMTVGMGIDIGLAFENLGWLTVIVVSLMVGKAVIATGLAMLFGQSMIASIRAGALLCQGGEFAFVLFEIASSNSLLGHETSQMLILAIAFSMALTPPFTVLAGRLARRIDQRQSHSQSVPQELLGISDHVIVCGYGRFGRTICKLLDGAGVRYVAVDLDASVVAQARADGKPVYHGDMRRQALLHGVGAERARALVVTMDADDHIAPAVQSIHRHFPDLDIFVRCLDASQAALMDQLGVKGAVPEIEEASLQLGQSVLDHCGVPHQESLALTAGLRRGGIGPRPVAPVGQGGTSVPEDPVVAASEELDRRAAASQMAEEEDLTDYDFKGGEPNKFGHPR
ncbi:MAG: monovalent cation:proton antiporter-2 (CPA2) family protein [Alphaproteobacteria bacterium]|nr:monovalent cation:proton antiporter-2 (CPA2) family protein [Alphaproteobacteria bacterium]